MMPLRALLVDDERLARKRLRELLAEHPQIEVAGEADSVETAAAANTELRPDVIFLDVDLPLGSGLDLLSRLPEVAPPAVVLVTAYENFAVQAFTLSALDYLLKPVQRERLALTVRRLQTARALDSRVALSDRQTRRTVELREIVAVQALGAYSRVNLRGLPAMIVLKSISEWERLLPAEFFVRIDRSLILQPAMVRLSERKSRDETLLSLEGVSTAIPIGRMGALRLRKHTEAVS